MALVGLKMVLGILSCVMGVTLVYGIVADNFSSCIDLHARWTLVAITDFMFYLYFVTAWYLYKESRWIVRAVLVLTQFCLGSCILCGYIVVQLFKLPREESLKDPLYFVLARRQKGDAISGNSGGPSVVATRVIVVALGCIMVGLIAIVIIIDGSPFRAEILSPITLCAYIARELFYLSREQDVSLILFSKSSRDLMLRDPLLHSNV